MPIRFDADRWARVAEISRRWWAGDLDRPLIQVRLHDADAGRPEPAIPPLGFMSHCDFSVSAADIVDRLDYDLCRQRYLGDAFPQIWPNFGPGIIAAFMGARVSNKSGTTWFHPAEELEIADVRLDLDEGNPWFVRVRDVMRAAAERWEGLVQVGMTDLGGNLDILSSFRPGENLLLDLYDHPEEVKRLTWRAHEAWWRTFDDLDAAVRPPNPGYTAWAPIFSVEPSYMLQCDFCYMIGPRMFDEFVRPELAASCRRLGNPFYHLDGPGQLPHLDSLLSIEELKGVQWVPGSGVPFVTHWPEVYRKIRKAGKLIQLFGGQEELDTVAGQIGGAEGIVLIIDAGVAQEEELTRFLRRYGVDPV